MESKEPEVLPKSVNIKRKKMTGHSFKAQWKRFRCGKTVKELEGPHKGYIACDKNNEGGTPKTTGTCIKCSKEERVSYNSQEKELCPCNDTADMELDGSAACKKFRWKDISTESEMISTIKQIQRKCNTRMKKLIQKQQQEIKEFHRVWKDKKLRVEKDNNLEASMIRLIYSESLGGTERLKMLDSSFRKQMEEDNILKEAQHKDLEMKQLAARNLERQKADNWLAEAKSSFYSEQTAVCGELSQDLWTDEDGGCMNLPVSSERVCDELESVEPNKAVLTEASEIVDYVEPVNLSNPSNAGDAISWPDELMDEGVGTDEIDTVGYLLTEKILEPLSEASSNECGSLSMPDSEQTAISGELSQNLLTDEDGGCMNLLASSERVCDELESVEPNKAVPTEASEIGDYVEPVNLSNSYNEEDAILCPDKLMNERVGTDEVETVGLLLTEDILEPFQEASSNQCGSLLTPVPESQIHASLVTDNPEVRDAPILEIGSLQIRDANSEPADTVLLSIDASPSSNLHPATDVEWQRNDSERNLFQTAEYAETLVLAHESSSQVGVLGIQNNHIDIGSARTDGLEDHIHESLTSGDLQDTAALVREGQGTLQIEIEASEIVDTVQFHSEVQTIENSEELHPISTDVSPSYSPSSATAVEHQNPESVRNFSPTSQVLEGLSQLHVSSRIERDLEIQSSFVDIGSLSRVAHDSGADMSTPSLNNMAVPQAAVDTDECANQSVVQLGNDAGNVYGSSTLFLHRNTLISPFLFVNPLENELKHLSAKAKHLEQSCKDIMSHLKSDCENEIQEIVAQIRSKYEMKLRATEAEFRLKISNLRKNRKTVFVNKALAFALSSTQTAPWASPGVDQGTPSTSSRQLHQQSLQQSSRFPPHSSASQPPSSLQVINPTLHTRQHLSIPHPPPHRPVLRAAAPSSMYPTAGGHTYSRAPPSQLLYHPPPAVPQQPTPPQQVSGYENHNTQTAPHNPFPPTPRNYNSAAPLPDISSSFGVLDSLYVEELGNVHAGNPSIAAASSQMMS